MSVVVLLPLPITLKSPALYASPVNDFKLSFNLSILSFVFETCFSLFFKPSLVNFKPISIAPVPPKAPLTEPVNTSQVFANPDKFPTCSSTVAICNLINLAYSSPIIFEVASILAFLINASDNLSIICTNKTPSVISAFCNSTFPLCASFKSFNALFLASVDCVTSLITETKALSVAIVVSTVFKLSKKAVLIPS